MSAARRGYGRLEIHPTDHGQRQLYLDDRQLQYRGYLVSQAGWHPGMANR